MACTGTSVGRRTAEHIPPRSATISDRGRRRRLDPSTLSRPVGLPSVTVMTTTWQTQNRRSAAIRETLTRLERTRDGELPWEQAARDVFGTPSELLRALQQVWFTRLTAALDQAMEDGGTDPIESVQMAWYELAWRFPGLRRVLDRHRDHAAVSPGRAQEQRMLAISAGLARLDEPAVVAAARGRRLVTAHQEPRPPRGWFANLVGLRPAGSAA
jgi:hypothetical protein